MGADTKIAWCDFTFNGWIGFEKVSPACKHCYAEVDTYSGPGDRAGSGKRKRQKGGDATASEGMGSESDLRQVTAPPDSTSGTRRELNSPPIAAVIWRVSRRFDRDDDAWDGPCLVSARTAWDAWQVAQREHTQDLTGQTLAGLFIVARDGSNRHGFAMWDCRCSRGHTFPVCGHELKRHVRRGTLYTCRRCQAELARQRDQKRCPRCKSFKPLTEYYICASKPDGHGSLCKRCDTSYRGPERANRTLKLCMHCAGLPHRVDGIRCRGCGLRYAPDTPVKLDTTSRRAGALAREMAP